MAFASDLAPQLVQAIAHPVRLRILAALEGRRLTVAALAAEVEANRRTVARHVRELERLGLIRRVEGVPGPCYEAGVGPCLSDDGYAALPEVVREAAVAAALAWVHTTATGALRAGGFNRRDIHLSRTSLVVAEEDWAELAAAFAALLERVEELERRPVRDGVPIHASAVLMLFERPEDGAAPPVHGGDGGRCFAAAEGRRRAVELAGEARALLDAPEPDWASVAALADQLRVVARASLACEHAGDAGAEDAAAAAAGDGPAPAAAPAPDTASWIEQQIARVAELRRDAGRDRG